MDVINFFYELARQNKVIKGFMYGKTYNKGAGNDVYPLVWLDDPISGTAYTTQERGRAIQYTVNVDFLGIPADEEEVAAVQSAAFDTGLAFFEKIKQVRPASGFSSSGFTFLTLRDYYDDNAAGVRFTYTIIHANPVDRCGEFFDPTKVFPKREFLPDFLVDNPDGCATFSSVSGLPNFKTK